MLLIYHNSHSCLHLYQMPRLRASLLAQQVKKKKSACNAGDKEDEGSGQEDPNPRLERSPREESGNLLCFMGHSLVMVTGLA